MRHHSNVSDIRTARHRKNNTTTGHGRPVFDRGHTAELYSFSSFYQESSKRSEGKSLREIQAGCGEGLTLFQDAPFFSIPMRRFTERSDDEQGAVQRTSDACRGRFVYDTRSVDRGEHCGSWHTTSYSLFDQFSSFKKDLFE